MMEQYNAMHEHNYVRDKKHKNRRWHDKTWYRNLSSRDEEKNIKDMPLSRLLKIEYEKDLLKEVRFC
jgi:hypothetical protein